MHCFFVSFIYIARARWVFDLFLHGEIATEIV